MRAKNRNKEELRPFSMERNFQRHAYASVLMKMGDTHVICAVTMEKGVPSFLKDSGQGWITAEYGMLPCATDGRYRREIGGRSGRTYEIQRLIGRSLRMMVDLRELGEHTLRVDCDVLNADGGTRTASITGGAIVVQQAITKMFNEGLLEKMPAITPVASISVGVVGGEVLLDLDYGEDSGADADGNFVMTANGDWIEVQTTAEEKPLSSSHLQTMMGLAESGIQQLFTLWEEL